MIDREPASLPAAALSRQLLGELFGGDGKGNVSVRLWDGTLWPDERPRAATLVLRHPGALRAMFADGTELGLSEAYLYDDFDIEGDIESVFGLADAVAASTGGWRKKLKAFAGLRRLPRPPDRQEGRRGRPRLSGRQHSVERDREAVRYHYDVSNDFYALWLDSRMVYSCAYFEGPDVDLDTAQVRKMDMICRKLRLRPGQRLLDIGCGWGGLALHAAREYGVDTTGITLSRPQADLANQKISAAGLAGRCRVEVRDYREVDSSQPYDALVSVGMFEHVGEQMLPAYFEKAVSLLKRGGVFLNHGIASRAADPVGHGPSFSATYVFPDGETLPINVTLRAAENAGFEVRDVESMREHYAMTLRHWVRRLEARHDEALKHVDELTYRVWRLFMAGSADGFRTRRLNVYQALLVLAAQDGASGQPLTRADWYSTSSSR
jgi:cyclopropane-fatty-acyl-phospholipid synthase